MLTRFDDIPVQDRIIVALDCNRDRAIEIADVLCGKAVWVKVGMTLYYAEGPSIISELKQRGFKIFLDLKFHDIPYQVEGAARCAVMSGADMITMHTTGGIAMMKAAYRGAELGALDSGMEMPVTLGITVLTSLDDDALLQTGVTRALHDQVIFLAQQAQKAGISGVVASPHEAADLRSELGPDAYIVTPGVRPEGEEHGDQSRVATPSQAFLNGASHIVIGRPIVCSSEPVKAFDEIALSVNF